MYLFICLFMMKTPWLKKHTFQNIFKFQNVKFECLHSYIKILNKNIRIWALLYLHLEVRL